MPVVGVDGVVRFGHPLLESELRQVGMDKILDGFGDEPHDVGHPVFDGIDENGLLAAITPEEAARHAVACVACSGQPDLQPDCDHCAGRGVVMSVPYPERPWDLVVGVGRNGETPTFSPPATPASVSMRGGLWLGGHYCQAGKWSCCPEDRFDTIVSLHKSTSADDYAPTNGASVYFYSMPDSALHHSHHGSVSHLAKTAAERALGGEQVLVRCRAGINRSALVTGLALLEPGYRPDEAVFMMRRVRSPYVLFNESFVEFIHRAARK